ncbi:hypothetical protein JMJ77_0013595, partial [Colletotrichum scovillei]
MCVRISLAWESLRGSRCPATFST